MQLSNQNKRKRAFLHLSFAVYILILLKLIFFKYPLSMVQAFLSEWGFTNLTYRVNLIPFFTIKSYIMAYVNGTLNVNIIMGNLIGNLAGFIPLGIFLPLLSDKLKSFGKILGIAFIFVLGIETCQLLTNLGSFDIDDIILNVLGAVFGFLIFKIMKKYFKTV
ncbi:VanZ family protein [Sinanaerobacter chloroacetimidivorans]|jgi:glycopeptide antibiotics resistance protein|uniref:VanZ family protein n=1 Tax=Sinanaerobacter chloroacetimidivorans TaxID=2818044 RepID=A0A8J7W3G0_9FIRM|nr:VanZ family protein [Sinanaerobacter chloroacetimidivorans]MBR0599676.1 VanZ family protein [Sinanaerobacter chloroacetimidivorans]